LFRRFQDPAPLAFTMALVSVCGRLYVGCGHVEFRWGKCKQAIQIRNTITD
jgi:hypothetical protein